MPSSQAAADRIGVARALLLLALLISGCDNSNSTEPTVEIRLEAQTATSLTGTVGGEIMPVPIVRATNQTGTPVPGIAISFLVTGDSRIVNGFARTDGDGIATVGHWFLGPQVGVSTVTARSRGLANVVFTATAVPGPVAQITPVGGNGQTARVGATLSNPLRVRVVDSFNNPIRSEPVTFTVLTGRGTIDGTTTITDSVGIAISGTWTLGPAQGAQQVRAETRAAQTVFTAMACDETCDQEQLLFERSDEIFATDLLGRAARRLVVGSKPAWSPDGRRIAFVRHVPGSKPSIYLMDADGSNVVHRADDFTYPAWSPDGRRLAVGRGDCAYECELYILSAMDDGTAPVRLAQRASQPAWSPDGRKIAFISLSGDDAYHALHIMNADGSGITEIAPRDEASIDRPTWSPDGRRIAFSKCIGPKCDIFVVNGDGSVLVQLTTVGNALGPAWSPDGTRIAVALYGRSAGSPGPSIAYVAADGGGEPIVIVTPGYRPAWRPRVENRQ